MSTSAEKLVKHTIKLIAKVHQLDYEELKIDAKKIIKLSQKYDQQLYGMMEELLDLGNIGSEEELEDFDIEVLKIYCRIKEISDSGSEKTIRANVWKNIQEEFELEEDSDDESESEIDSESESETEVETEVEPEIETEVEVEVEPEPEPVLVKQRKSKKN